jgi:hypothetical protein
MRRGRRAWSDVLDARADEHDPASRGHDPGGGADGTNTGPSAPYASEYHVAPHLAYVTVSTGTNVPPLHGGAITGGVTVAGAAGAVSTDADGGGVTTTVEDGAGAYATGGGAAADAAMAAVPATSAVVPMIARPVPSSQ